MKKIINIIKGLFVVIIITSTVVSCSETTMDEINQDNDHTKVVLSKFILADVITATAFNNIGGDLNTYTSVYVEHEVGVDNQLYRAEKRTSEPSSSTTFNNVWQTTYSALKNARIIIAKCSKGGDQEGNQVTKGMAEVLAALNSALIADMFGDAPWSEAALINEVGSPLFMNPKVDKQQDIYAGVMKYLDAAIVDLAGKDAHISGGPGAYDLLYAGDKTKWLKLAYGLKARYTMRLLKTYASADLAAKMKIVLDNVALSFTSADEQAAFAIYDASNLNPLFDFYTSREALGASKSMSEKLAERNDPRLRRVFVNAKEKQVTGITDPIFLMAPNGTNDEKKGYYNTSTFVYAQTAPTLFLSYHEILFLKAEALARTNSSLAEAALSDAVVAAIANTEVNVSAAISSPDYGITETTAAITPAEALSYFQNNVKPLFITNPLKEIMIQKYIAFFGASGESTECYSDIRRMKALGENFVTLKNPLNTSKFPLRCPYGSDDTLNNPNVQAIYGDGQYVYTTPVWWAGGTR